MRDIFSPTTEYHFSEKDFEELQTNQDTEIIRIAEVLKKILPSLEVHVNAYVSSVKGLEGMCQVVTSFLDRQFKAAGFDTQILEGDVLIAPHHTLEHRVNWIRTPEHWVVIDMTAKQIPRLKKQPVFIKVVAPNPQALKEMLQTEYGWWFPDEKKGNA